MMYTLVCWLLSLIFVALALLHIYWIAGGQWAAAAAIPSHENGKPLFMPGKLATLVVVGGLLFFAMLCFQRLNIITFPLPAFINSYGLWVVSAIFMVRSIGDFHYFGLFKKLKNSAFAVKDSEIYTPLCIFLSVACFYIA